MPVFTRAKLRDASDWLAQFRVDWAMETPLAIHSFGIDDGHGLGGPPFHPEFESWLGQICFCGRAKDPNDPNDRGCPSFTNRRSPINVNPNRRLRTTRAFRRLRRVAPREFDALYLMSAHGMGFYSTMAALNERSIRLDKPERYDELGTLLLILSGVDKVKQWW